MSKLSKFINMEIDTFESQMETCNQMLKNGNPGRLNVATVKNTDYYYANDGNRRYLGRADSDEVQRRIQYHFFDQYSSMLASNIKACNKCISELREYDPYSVIDSFSKAYKNVPDECIAQLGFVPNSVITNFSIGVPYMQEGLRHKTASGIMVRSKSEAMIANTYTIFNVEFAYEKLLILPDGTEILPDFSLLSRDHTKEIYHEHVGMLHLPEYRESFHRKIDLYIDNGYIPFRDVFFTFEDKNGNIDFEAIYQIIQYIKSL